MNVLDQVINEYWGQPTAQLVSDVIIVTNDDGLEGSPIQDHPCPGRCQRAAILNVCDH